MKLARFEHNGKVKHGMVEAEELRVIKGSFWSQYEVKIEGIGCLRNKVQAQS